MNEHEKEIIRRNRRFIQENVFNIDDVADLLYEKGILTLNNKELVAVSFFHMPLNWFNWRLLFLGRNIQIPYLWLVSPDNQRYDTCTVVAKTCPLSRWPCNFQDFDYKIKKKQFLI